MKGKRVELLNSAFALPTSKAIFARNGGTHFQGLSA